jgi:SAM-dependent methyltransferase
VDRIPEDPDARRAWLERWAAEKQKQLPRSHRARVSRLWRKTAKTIELLVDRLDRVFDRGLDTSRHVYDVPETADVDGVIYVPSAWHVLPRALRAVGAGDRDVFVDFGCGKGRIVHQAARWPLRRVIGVEVSTELADFARTLVAAHSREHRCRNVEIVVCDAAQFPVADDVTIAYFFDPFRDKTFDAVLDNLVDSIDRHPRRLRLIYVNPIHGAQVLATGRFRLVKWQRGGLRDVRISRAAIFESYLSPAGASAVLGPSAGRRRRRLRPCPGR